MGSHQLDDSFEQGRAKRTTPNILYLVSRTTWSYTMLIIILVYVLFSKKLPSKHAKFAQMAKQLI